MPIWALIEDGKEIAAFRGFTNSICREDCETEAVELGLAAVTRKGVALAPGVEVVCLTDD